jgi:peroxiredoxin
VSSFSRIGRSSKIGFAHFPHFGPAVTLLASILFQVSQNWQRTVSFLGAALASVSIEPQDLLGSVMTSVQLQNSPQVGDAAPGFTAASTSGQDVSLSSFLGKRHVLLAFFPLAFTSTCTKELICFSEDFDQFAGNDVEILPMSVDSVPSLREFKNKLQMKTELLSDFKREVSRAYGVLNEDRFFSNRAYFLIDKEGRVRWSYVEGNNSQRRENSEILAAIQRLS